MSDEPSPDFLPLWGLLRGHGHLWHRTSLPSLECILREGAIIPNTGQFATTFPQSKISYSRGLGAVSLFDFDTSDEPYIFDHHWKWITVLAANLPPVVLIRIRRHALDPAKLLLPADISRGDPRLDTLPDEVRRGQMVIPAVEALHIGSIPVSAFDGFILIAFKSGGGYHLHEVAERPDALRVLSDVGAQWTAARERLTEERHARGEYTLAEIIEASQKRE
jgi:hypothetical protein